MTCLCRFAVEGFTTHGQHDARCPEAGAPTPPPRHWLAPTSQGGAASSLKPDCWPFDPHPPAKTPASNGYIRCPDCETVVEAAGHECGRTPANLAYERDAMSAVAQFERSRAEFAESLLCALAFDHGRPWYMATECRSSGLGCILCSAERKP